MASMLLPDEVAATLPLLYSQESKGESAVAKVKFFCLASGWTWYELNTTRQTSCSLGW